MSTIRHTRNRLQRVPLPSLVLVGDLAVLGGLLWYGFIDHGVDPFASPEHAILVAVPFLFGWLFVAPLAGLYNEWVIRSGFATVLLLVPVWLFVTLVGSMFRAMPALPGMAPPIFVLVMLGFGLLAMLTWRLVVVAVTAQ